MTILRNGLKFDFPFLESIRSLLPICDEVIVALGQSDDGTRNAVLSLNHPKIRIVDTVWDLTKNSGGVVLAEETNKALQQCSGDWCLYLQADEVLHESEIHDIRSTLQRAHQDDHIDGIVFPYYHFYGSYMFINQNPKVYRREVRIIRNHRGITSYRDAQGFRKHLNEKLRVISTQAHIYHYGYCRPPSIMREKMQFSDSLYGHKPNPRSPFTGHSIPWVYGIEPFQGTHPQVMDHRISQCRWKVEFTKTASNRRDYIKQCGLGIRRIIERLTGWLPGEYRNYLLVGNDR